MKNKKMHAVLIMAIVFVFGLMDSAKAEENVKSSTNDVRSWMVNGMVSWSRPGRSMYPEAVESFDDGKARYGFIADSVLNTVAKQKPLFSGSKGRIRTAALLLSISLHESGFRKDVDLNLGAFGRGDSGRSWCLMQVQLGAPIYIDENGKKIPPVHACENVTVEYSKNPIKKCQFIAPEGAVASTPSRIVFVGETGYEMTSDQTIGYSGQDLIENRELCFSAGLRIIRGSFNACRQLPMLERLSVYTSGSCENGKEASRRRISSAIRWMEQFPSPVSDEELVAMYSDVVNDVFSERDPISSDNLNLQSYLSR